jgi:hypothetical protein
MDCCEYTFCSNSSCDTVYYNGFHSFSKDSLKVPVFQPVDEIKEHIRLDQCDCEVNNPQGSCCLGNVSNFLSTNAKKGPNEGP